MLDIDAAFLQRHRFREVSHSSDAFFLPVCALHCLIQHFCILDPKDLFGKRCHAEHIIVCMHGIIAQIVLDDLQDASSDKILICHLLHRSEDKRVVCDYKISSRLNCTVYHSICGIQCKIDPVHFLFRASCKKPHIVKPKGGLPRIRSLDHLYDFFTQHSIPSLSLHISIPVPEPFCVLRSAPNLCPSTR